MIVKYYGFGELDHKGDVTRNAVLNVLRWTAPDTAARHMTLCPPSACLWLVPGTFDLEGRYVE
jgi:hypothetical protein